jgi:hypothetical protein
MKTNQMLPARCDFGELRRIRYCCELAGWPVQTSGTTASGVSV